MPTSSTLMSVKDMCAPKPVMNRNVPPFLNKLYNMVNDPQSNDMIHWSEKGDSFIVKRQQEFEKTVLPKFFKHDHFSTFVRQLNMYGFHKVPHLQQGALHNVEGFDQLEYTNPHFKRDQPDLLTFVTRKKSRSGGGDLLSEACGDPSTGTSNNNNNNNAGLKRVLDEIATVKNHQTVISTDLKLIQKENQILWKEAMAARERQQQQQETVDKLLQFLASVFSTADKHKRTTSSNHGGNITRKKRTLLIDSHPMSNEDEEKPPAKIARTTTTAPDSISLSTSPTNKPLDLPPSLMTPLDLSDIYCTSTPSGTPGDKNINSLDISPPSILLFNNHDSSQESADMFLNTSSDLNITPYLTETTTKTADLVKSAETISNDIDQLCNNINPLVAELDFDNELWNLDSFL